MSVVLLADIGRAVALVLLVAVIVLSVVTLRGHVERLRRREPDHLLSRHVVLVATSHIGVMSIVAVETTARWGETPTARLPFALLFGSLTLVALVDLVRFQYQRAAWNATQRRRVGDR